MISCEDVLSYVASGLNLSFFNCYKLTRLDNGNGVISATDYFSINFNEGYEILTGF